MIIFARQASRQHTDHAEQQLSQAGHRVAGSLTRRRACRALGGGALGAVLSGLGLSDALAGCRRGGQRCRRNSQCCSRRCKRNKCRRARDGSKSTIPQIDIGSPSPIEIPPPPIYVPPVTPTSERRRVAISGEIGIYDEESFPEAVGNELCRYRLDEVSTAVLTPGDSFDRVRLSRGCGGEVRVELELNASLLDNGDVRISGHFWLFEGTSEATRDLDGAAGISIIVPKDATTTRLFIVRNEDEGGDLADAQLTFRNVAA